MEAESWRVTLNLKSYAIARTVFQLGMLLDHHSVEFAGLDKDGEPLWTNEDEERLTAMLRDS